MFLQTIGDPVASLTAMELTLSNVLIPECTDGTTYDALYCDASLSEEDLPTFLSLLKPGGKMVVVIEEDALLVVRGTAGDPHDFSREVGLLLCCFVGRATSNPNHAPVFQSCHLKLQERQPVKYNI